MTHLNDGLGAALARNGACAARPARGGARPAQPAALVPAGFAFQLQSPAIAVVGVMVTILYWLVEAQRKMHQRAFIDRIQHIEVALEGSPLVEALQSGKLGGLQTTRAFALPEPRRLPSLDRWKQLAAELSRVNTFLLYAGVALMLTVCAVVVAGMDPEGADASRGQDGGILQPAIEDVPSSDPG